MERKLQTIQVTPESESRNLVQISTYLEIGMIFIPMENVYMYIFCILYG